VSRFNGSTYGLGAQNTFPLLALGSYMKERVL
jgi:hypothetical protein